MSLRVVIGIDYDEQAFYDASKSSVETYKGVYVFIGPDFAEGRRVFNTGDPVKDFDAAREFARERSDDIYLSSTFDFFPKHSLGSVCAGLTRDGYRTILWSVDSTRCARCKQDKSEHRKLGPFEFCADGFFTTSPEPYPAVDATDDDVTIWNECRLCGSKVGNNDLS